MAPPNEPNGMGLDGFHGSTCDNVLSLADGKLVANGAVLLSDVPGNVTLSGFSSICQNSQVPTSFLDQVLSRSHKGGFLGFKKESPSDRLLNSLGRLTNRNFLSIFRFKTWWSTMWVGNSGSDLQMETQWVLLDIPETKSYALILPLIEGKFRSALHPGCSGDVLICAESGSTTARSSSFDAIAYVHISDNPYNLMKEAYSAARVHLNTFKLLEEKSVPPIVDRFGWCTWDAFYLTVDPVGISHGVGEFAEGGLTPRFLIIDDGWQSISTGGENPLEDAKNLVLGGTQMTARLYRFEECDKFKNYKEGTLLGSVAPPFDPKKPKLLISKAIEIEHAEKARDKAVESGVTDLTAFESKIQLLKQELNEIFGVEAPSVGDMQNCANCCCKPVERGLKAFTKDLRTKFRGLDDIYVWHALAGAWGGVRPGATHLKAKVLPVTISPGLDGTMTDLAVVKTVEGGIGLVHPDQAADFFESMHSYLAKAGITGVKVDVIHTLEYICEEYGGRVELAKAYYEGLSKSLVNNFNGTGLLSSMEQCNDFFFLGTSHISFGRVGDDFWFQDPNGDPMGVYWLQGVHMIHCAYNSMWMGQIIQPDWDMFQSDHLCAKFHAGSRAICGGPIYVSDSVGGHDFDLLKKLVFPDGTIPRCQHFALPTRDCLFQNPLFDGKTVLKIWNLNKYGGVVGAFNCQGAGWDPSQHRIRGYSHCYKPITGSVRATDIEWNQVEDTSMMGEAEEYALYLNQAEQLMIVSPETAVDITIQPSNFEIFSYVPVMKLTKGIKFAQIGLVDMFNSGGTLQGMEYKSVVAESVVGIKIKGGGKFLAYSSIMPKQAYLNGVAAEMEYSSSDGSLYLNVAWNEECNGVSDVQFAY